ncbi:hypothetical protein BX666DRAFT_1517065 [Dichotomocladium elegans]|nr:hypothetical protein BX666DRAFT_1517065 [Dichotomocladium elegans]
MIHSLMKYEAEPYILSNWAYHIKLDMMEKILLLGFELELYGSHEYEMIIFYLIHLFHEHVQCLEDAQKRIIRQMEDEGGPPTIEGRMSEINAMQHIQYQKHKYHLFQNMTSATYKMIVFLQTKTCQLETLTPLFDDPETRFLHRFKSFFRLNTPVHICYQDFRDARQVDDVAAQDILESAKANYEAAKRIILLLTDRALEHSRTEMCRPEYLTTLNLLARTSTANLVAVCRLKDKTNSTKRVRVSFGGHPWWPIFDFCN